MLYSSLPHEKPVNNKSVNHSSSVHDSRGPIICHSPRAAAIIYIQTSIDPTKTLPKTAHTSKFLSSLNFLFSTKKSRAHIIYTMTIHLIPSTIHSPSIDSLLSVRPLVYIVFSSYRLLYGRQTPSHYMAKGQLRTVNW